MSADPPDRTIRAGGRWFTLFTLAWLAVWTAQLTPLQLLLPLQLDTPDSAEGWIRGVVSSGFVLGIGGLAGVIAGPLAGTLSDRGGGQRRRRRPWALAGVWIAAICLLLTGAAMNVWQVGAAWVGVSAGLAVAAAAFTALIADQLPVEQRGAASAATSSSQAVGIVLGVGAVVLLGLSVGQSYAALAAFIAVCGTAAALFLPDPPRTGISGSPIERAEHRLAFLRDRDFRWILIGRLVVNIGNALGTSLFLFFLLYGLRQPSLEAQDNLLLLIVVYTVFVVAASIGSGMLSDRLRRRRRLTILSAVVQATSGLVIVLSPTFGATLIAAALMGIGYGGYSTVGLAFATDSLPSREDHGRDLGILNVTAALGQLLGPVLGAGLVAIAHGFWLVFAAAMVLSLIGAGLTALAREKSLR